MLKLASIFAGVAGAVVGAIALGVTGAPVEAIGVGALAGGAAASVSCPVIYRLTEAVTKAIAPGPDGLALLPVAIAAPLLGSQAVAVAAAGMAARSLGLMP